MRPKLVRRGRNRWYVDLDRPIPGEPGKFERIPGVTTITKAGMPKQALMNWAGTATAEFVVNNWDELAELPPADRLNRINKGRYESRDAAGDRGTTVHTLARELMGGAEVPVPKELRGYVDAARRFMDQFDAQEFATELVVFSETHYYCGQLDVGASVLIPDLSEYDWIPRDDNGRSRMLGDYKTARSGIWGDLGYQLAPYRFADWAIEDGEVIEVPEFDFGAGIHLRPDGTYSVVPVECGEREFDEFLTIKANAAVADRAADLVLTEIVPPRGPRYRLELIDEGF
jgi:hypothetical protein